MAKFNFEAYHFRLVQSLRVKRKLKEMVRRLREEDRIIRPPPKRPRQRTKL